MYVCIYVCVLGGQHWPVYHIVYLLIGVTHSTPQPTELIGRVFGSAFSLSLGIRFGWERRESFVLYMGVCV